jgi:hypothetical protein
MDQSIKASKSNPIKAVSNQFSNYLNDNNINQKEKINELRLKRYADGLL